MTRQCEISGSYAELTCPGSDPDLKVRWNLARDTGYPKVFSGFPQSLQPNSGIIP
jgi:hypothetical protein